VWTGLELSLAMMRWDVELGRSVPEMEGSGGKMWTGLKSRGTLGGGNCCDLSGACPLTNPGSRSYRLFSASSLERMGSGSSRPGSMYVASSLPALSPKSQGVRKPNVPPLSLYVESTHTQFTNLLVLCNSRLPESPNVPIYLPDSGAFINPESKARLVAPMEERERFTSSPTFLCGNNPATLG